MKSIRNVYTVYIYIHTHTHTHIHMYIYIYTRDVSDRLVRGFRKGSKYLQFESKKKK
jgi:hypothetical protein